MDKRYQTRDFWNETALRFGKKNDYAPVLHPSAKGLLNWYTDWLQKHALNNTLKKLDEKFVLEVGCGVGRWCERLAKAGSRVIGIDVSREMVKKARYRISKQKTNSDFVVSSADKLPFVPQIFDSVISVTVLQHIVVETLFKSAIADMARVVKKGGNIILLEYIARSEGNHSLSFPTVAHCYEEAFVDSLGFSLVKVQGVDLSVFLRPFNQITKKYGKYGELLGRLEPSSRYLLSAALFYYMVSIASLLSLPLDLIFRNIFRQYSEHMVFIFSSK